MLHRLVFVLCCLTISAGSTPAFGIEATFIDASHLRHLTDMGKNEDRDDPKQKDGSRPAPDICPISRAATLGWNGTMPLHTVLGGSSLAGADRQCAPPWPGEGSKHVDYRAEVVMPTVLRVGRFRFFFFSNEGQEPPHIHVKAGSDEAKFWLNPVQLAANYGFNGRELNRIQQAIEEHTDELLEAWHDHFGA